MVEYRTQPVARAAKRRLLFLTERVEPAVGGAAASDPPASSSTPSRRLLYAQGTSSSGGGGLVEPAYRSRSASEAAEGLEPSVGWPAAAVSPAGSAQVDRSLPQSSTQVAAYAAFARSFASKANGTSPPSPPPSPCLGGCNARGVCFNGKCFCDPGWVGSDCGHEQACPVGCANHGQCAYGLCYCDAGWEGEACEVPVACPGQCNGRGTCANAKCYCEPGWKGEACEAAAPLVDRGCNVSLWTAGLSQLPVVFLGLLIGWGIKHVMEQRQRAKMREILQQDAQRPFSSGASG
jgi:hypothetical protein